MNIKIVKLLIFWLIIPSIIGCSSNSPTAISQKQTINIPLAPKSKFQPQPDIIKPEDILALTNKHAHDLDEYFYQSNNHSTPKNKRLSKYLQQYVKNYFYFNRTLTANESLDRSQGNCLSLAILTTAFAKHVGIDIGYQLVDSTPVYQEENGIVLSSEHVRSLLYEQKSDLKSGTFFFSRPAIAIDYFPSRKIKVRRQVFENEFYAMFYRNKAAEAIVEKNNIRAYWLLRQALEFNPRDQHAINMLALVHEYRGLKEYAEAIFKYGIRKSKENLILLKNYKIFLQREGRYKEAKRIAMKLASHQTKNPFDWIKLGNISQAQGNYSEAISYFKKAIKIAPYVHQAYFGIAKSELLLGHHDKAKKALEKAKANAFEVKDKDLYQAKLTTLTKE